MLTIDWSGTDADGWYDRIPMSLFRPDGRTPSTSYLVTGPEGTKSEVRCSVESEGNISVLDYGGRHVKANDGWEPIALKIVFQDDMRDKVIGILYRSAKGTKFVQAEASFWMDENELALIEANPKLVHHMRLERRPELAKRKKADMLAIKSHLECEACDTDFRRIYGDQAQACYEAHHDVPLAKRGVGPTKVSDLKILCANCHRAIHRTEPMMRVEAFRKALQGI